MERKTIKDFPEYSVGCDGTIWSNKENKRRCRNPIRKLKGFIHNGYRYIDLVDKNRHKRYSVHYLVAKYFVPGYFRGAVVNHIDGNGLNNDFSNLEWITQKENVRKSYTTSGINQTRNYKIYRLVSPTGDEAIFKRGYGDVINYIKTNNIDVAIHYLRVCGHSRGWTLLTYNKGDNSYETKY